MTATALVFVTATALVFVTATVVVEGTNGMKVDPFIVGRAVEVEASVVVELAISAKTNKQLKEIVETSFYFSYRRPFPGATDPRNAKGIGRR